MPTKSPELSEKQKGAIYLAVQEARKLEGPDQESLIPIDLIEDKATRMAIISALQTALREDEVLGGGVIASLFQEGNTQSLRVSIPPQR